MPYPNAIDVCRADLFTKEAELKERYPILMVEKILRVREMYNWFIANPDATDREFVAELMQRHDVAKGTAYSDLQVVKKLLPMFAASNKDFHRWRANEMCIATYKMAEKRKDTKTMEKTVATYAKINRVDLEDEQAIPFDKIMVQPFTATDDPRVLGIEPIPNIQDKISAMIEKYSAETIDIEDVQFEEVDLEFDSLFPNTETANNDTLFDDTTESEQVCDKV
jgi:hypothetical protein